MQYQFEWHPFPPRYLFTACLEKGPCLPAACPAFAPADVPMPPCHMCLVAALLSVAPAGAVTSKKDALDRRLQKGGSARVGGPATIASGGTNGSAYTAMMVWWCEKPERMETQECVRSKLYQQLRQTHDKEGNAIVLDRLKNVSPTSTHRNARASATVPCEGVGEGHVRPISGNRPVRCCL